MVVKSTFNIFRIFENAGVELHKKNLKIKIKIVKIDNTIIPYILFQN